MSNTTSTKLTFSEALEANKTSAVVNTVDAAKISYGVGSLIESANRGRISSNQAKGTWALVREPRVIWVKEFADGSLSETNYDSIGQARINQFNLKRCVKFVEVIDE